MKYIVGYQLLLKSKCGENPAFVFILSNDKKLTRFPSRGPSVGIVGHLRYFY